MLASFTETTFKNLFPVNGCFASFECTCGYPQMKLQLQLSQNYHFGDAYF